MTRIFKYLIILLVVIVGLLATAVAVINLLPSDKYKDLIASGVKLATGRDLVIEGDVDVKLLSTFAVKASGIKFTNADWGSRPHMASVKNIEAEVALLPLLKGILDVTLLVDAPQLLLETEKTGQGNWVFKELLEAKAKKVVKTVETVKEIKESVEEDQSVGGLPLRLYIRKVAVTGTRIVYIDGKSGDRMTIVKKKLILVPVDGKLTIDLEATFNDIPLALSGNFGNADLLLANQPNPISLTGHVGDIKLAIDGTTGPLTPDFDLNVNVKLNVDTVAAISPLAGQELPDIGPLAVSGQFIGKKGKYTVSDLSAILDDKIMTAKVKASIADLVTMKGLAFEADVSTSQLNKACAILGLNLEPTTSEALEPAVAAKGNDEKSTVQQAQDESLNQIVNIALTEGVTTGPIKTITIDNVPAEALQNVESLDQIVKIAQTGGVATSPSKTNGDIGSATEVSGSKETKTDLNSAVQVKVAATVANVLQLSGINADIKLSLGSLSLLNDLAQQQLPASDPVTLDGNIVSKGLKSPVNLDIELKSGGVMVSVKGSIAEPLTAKGIELELNAEGESMQQVGKLTGTEFLSTEPIKLTGKFISSENNYELSGLRLQVGQFDVKGNASFQQPAQPDDRPKVSAALHIGELDLRKRQKAELEEVEENVETTETGEEKIVAEDKEKKKKVFTSDPLPWGPLRNMDADIELTVESLKTLQLNLEQVTAGVTLDNGLLTMNPLHAKVGDGNFGGAATLDARNSPAAFVVDIELSNATFTDFGGKVNFLIDLEGSGDSVAEIMAGLDGQVHFDVREAILKASLMTGFGSGLLSSLNPFSKDEENTELICAIALFDIKEGVADANKTIAAQMTDVTWFGSGEINLVTEEIEFGMSPKARKGLGGLGSLAKLAYLGGTLAEPKVAFDPKDVAVKYGKYSAAIATGGLTLVADLLFSRIKANTDVCSGILEKLDKIQAADKKADEEKEVKEERKDEAKTQTKPGKKAEKKQSKAKNLLDSGDSYL